METQQAELEKVQSEFSQHKNKHKALKAQHFDLQVQFEGVKE